MLLTVGGVGQAGLNDGVRQLGIVGHDLDRAHAPGKPPQHVADADTKIANARAAAAATRVERTTRFTAILGLRMGKDSDGLADAPIEHTRVLPALFRKSLTWDQGSEMAHHAHLTLVTGMDVYFADPHSPWQRGGNENTNRGIRLGRREAALLLTHDGRDLSKVVPLP